MQCAHALPPTGPLLGSGGCRRVHGSVDGRDLSTGFAAGSRDPSARSCYPSRGPQVREVGMPAKPLPAPPTPSSRSIDLVWPAGVEPTAEFLAAHRFLRD